MYIKFIVLGFFLKGGLQLQVYADGPSLYCSISYRLRGGRYSPLSYASCAAQLVPDDYYAALIESRYFRHIGKSRATCAPRRYSIRAIHDKSIHADGTTVRIARASLSREGGRSGATMGYRCQAGAVSGASGVSVESAWSNCKPEGLVGGARDLGLT